MDKSTTFLFISRYFMPNFCRTSFLTLFNTSMSPLYSHSKNTSPLYPAIWLGMITDVSNTKSGDFERSCLIFQDLM
jgi:hypothetical protein